jgi:hypothetical protein
MNITKLCKEPTAQPGFKLRWKKKFDECQFRETITWVGKADAVILQMQWQQNDMTANRGDKGNQPPPQTRVGNFELRNANTSISILGEYY